MVLTKAELVLSLHHEVDILLHLASKVETSMADYRPTPKQRSTLELLRYLTYMGPLLLDVAKAGTFEPAAWSAAETRVASMSLEDALAEIAAHKALYTTAFDAFSDGEWRADIAPFGQGMSRGAFLVNNVLCGCAAYRTQLFLYLKSSGRDELNTWNLWMGMDEPAKA
jgi:hypothetical protein